MQKKSLNSKLAQECSYNKSRHRNASAPNPDDYPLIVYVHIPKTGGTSVETVLGYCTNRERSRIDMIDEGENDCLYFARSADWISGHWHRNTFSEQLIWLSRPIEYFATVREPKQQLISHLNYSFERYRRSNYLATADDAEQMLDADVMATDFTKPASIIKLLLQYRMHYLNSQARYLLGRDFEDLPEGEVMRRLRTYTHIAPITDLPSLYRAFGFVQFPQHFDNTKENTANYHFDIGVFDTPELKSFLEYHHKYDFHIFDLVNAIPWQSHLCAPFRPIFLETGLFDHKNFDEQRYLDANPDVEADVINGVWNSGWDHFVQYGQFEVRRMREWTLPDNKVSEAPVTQYNSSSPPIIKRLQRLRDERR